MVGNSNYLKILNGIFVPEIKIVDSKFNQGKKNFKISLKMSDQTSLRRLEF